MNNKNIAIIMTDDSDKKQLMSKLVSREKTPAESQIALPTCTIVTDKASNTKLIYKEHLDFVTDVKIPHTDKTPTDAVIALGRTLEACNEAMASKASFSESNPIIYRIFDDSQDLTVKMPEGFDYKLSDFEPKELNTRILADITAKDQKEAEAKRAPQEQDQKKPGGEAFLQAYHALHEKQMPEETTGKGSASSASGDSKKASGFAQRLSSMASTFFFGRKPSSPKTSPFSTPRPAEAMASGSNPTSTHSTPRQELVVKKVVILSADAGENNKTKVMQEFAPQTTATTETTVTDAVHKTKYKIFEAAAPSMRGRIEAMKPICRDAQIFLVLEKPGSDGRHFTDGEMDSLMEKAREGVKIYKIFDDTNHPGMSLPEGYAFRLSSFSAIAFYNKENPEEWQHDNETPTPRK